MNGHPFSAAPEHCSPQMKRLLLLIGLLLFELLFLFTQSAFAAVAFRAATSASATSGSLSAINTTSGTFAERTTCGDVTPSIPTGNIGDLLIAQIVARRNNSTVTMPGWNTLFSNNVADTDYQALLFWRSATGGDPNTITQAGTCDHLIARITRFGNVDTVRPLETQPLPASNWVYGNTSSVNTGTQNINAAYSMLVLATFVADNRRVSQDGTFTQLYDIADASAADAGFSLNYRIDATTGTKGPFLNMNLSWWGSDPNHGVLFAVRPAPLTGLTINTPAGTTANDAMIATIAFRPCSSTNGGTCTTTITPPNGWTLVRGIDTTTGGGTGGYGSRHFVYRRTATAAEPASYTWGIGGTPVHAGAVGGIQSFSGVDPTNPIVAEAGQPTTNAYTHTAPSIDTGTVTGTMLVSSHSSNSSGNWTPPTGMTERIDIPSRPVPDALGISIEANTELRATSGATGTRTATISNPPASDTGAAHLLALRPTTSETLNHIRIEHDGLASSCAPETITIKACADASCSSLYLGSVTVNLSNIGTWSTDPVTFSDGQTTVTLAASGLVTLGGTATSPTATNGATCYNTTTATNDCALNFSSASFAFDIPDHTSATKQLVTITACASHFANKTRAVKFWSTYIDPNTGTKQGLVVKGTGDADCATGYSALGTSEAGATPLNLDFGSGSSPQATFSLCYPDAGKVQLDARYDGSSTNSPPDAGVVVLGNDSFVAKPYGFMLSDIKQTASPQLTNPAAFDASGAKFVKAGEAFTATVTAKNAKNETTPNFSKEAAPEGVKLTANLFAPIGGTNPILTCKGSTANCLVPGGATHFTNGAATVTDLSWEEVGIITLTPSIGDSNYLSAGDVTGTTSGNIGRFYPNHFAITPSPVTEGCDAGNFTYFGQDGFFTAFTLTAKNATNTTTQNYTGGFAKLVLTAWNNYTFTAAGLPAGSTLAASTTAPTGTWTNGAAAVVATHQATRPIAPVVPANITVSAQPIDTDGVTMAAALAVHAATTPLYFGRMVVQNSYGSETEDHRMVFQTQFFNIAAQWATNGQDSCTTLAANNFGFGNYLQQLTAAEMNPGHINAGLSTLTAMNGRGSLFLTRPTGGDGKYVGSVDVCADLGPDTLSAGSPPAPNTAPVCVAVSANLPWLQGRWSETKYDDDPTGRVNFGIYRGNDRIINWREIIR
jgi:hypothetical protein